MTTKKTENQPYKHPTSVLEFEQVYRREHAIEIESCDGWINWCRKQNDDYGVNFHQGRKSALEYNNIKMEQLLRVLKQLPPNKSETVTTERVEEV